MRIISGSKKGKKLILPDPEITRPLKDNVKENIFNILVHTRNFKFNFKDSIIIDFFSGSGSFGLECLSRGSKKVYFIENDKKIQNTLYRNLTNNFNKEKFEMIKKDFFKLDVLAFINKKKPDIIFFDPPYDIKNFKEIYKLINNLSIKRTTIILHVESSRTVLFNTYENILEKTYARSKILFLKK